MDFRAIFLPALLWAVCAVAQAADKPIDPSGPARPANADKTYAALRSDAPGGESLAIKDLTLKREGAVFHFDAGNFYFYPPVEGRVTGAVFEGTGRFVLAPEQKSEQISLTLLTKSSEMSQDFTVAVFRFSDGTAEEIRKASAGAAPGPDGRAAGAAEELEKGFRKTMHENLDLRLLADVMGGAQGQFFLASFRMGGTLTGKNVLFIVDPEGTFHATPDEAELTTWSDFEVQPWVAYRMTDANPAGRGDRIKVTDERLDTTIERNGMLHVKADTTFKVLRDGMRVVRLDLYPTLRVSGVYAENGAPLDFVQEAKDLDPDFAVILPAPAKAGDTLRLHTVYDGKGALRADGNDTYYLMPGARETWYPSEAAHFGNFASFHMTFHFPRQLTIVATGKQVSLTQGGGVATAVWETESPIAVAGFNLGDFKKESAKTPQGFGIDAYADVGVPDQYSTLLLMSDTLGGLSSIGALKSEVSQGSAAVQIYSNYFGKLPYDHVALTEQTACSYGQSWPMLVYLPTCGFWDITVQHQLGLDPSDTYWKVVTPHEVAHQWWGQLVGFNSYRDQWMSEGFADFSASIFLKETSQNMDQYHNFWKELQKQLIEKNTEGVRAIDAGPLTMGLRVNNSKAGENLYSVLIYNKGAYVLHMLEMLYWTPQNKEEAFKHSMQQFVQEYAGKAASTEDWKASMEKTMPKSMDVNGDGKLDWFFNEWVYGTELPHYTVSSEFTVDAAGATTASLKLEQSNVSKDFVMIVPLYLQMANGSTVHIAGAVLHGDTTVTPTIKLGKLPSPAKALLVNVNQDVLTDN